MNIEEYISSGVVESYVLGLASKEEREEFERLSLQYPAIMKARIDFELALEKQAFENAIAPSAGVRDRVLNQVNVGETTLSPPSPVRSISWWKYAAAASLLLLAGSLYFNIDLYRKNKALQQDYDQTTVKLNDVENDIRVLQQNPNVKMASMKGMEASPASFATVYWDTASRDVYLMINNMPAPPSDQQYQLWAFLGGKPIDMGLIEITEKPLQLYRLKKAQAAEAFAITLEKKGRPDISVPGGTVYVMGKL